VFKDTEYEEFQKVARFISDIYHKEQESRDWIKMSQVNFEAKNYIKKYFIDILNDMRMSPL